MTAVVSIFILQIDVASFFHWSTFNAPQVVRFTTKIEKSREQSFNKTNYCYSWGAKISHRLFLFVFCILLLLLLFLFYFFFRWPLFTP